MKNVITYLKTLWRWGADSQSSDVSHDCRLTVGSPSGLDAKLQVNTFMRFAVVLTLIFTLGSGNAWGADETLTITGASSEHNAPWTTSYGTSTGTASTSASTDISLSWTNVGRMQTGIQIKGGTSNGFYSTSCPTTNNKIKSITITNKTNSGYLYCSTDGKNWSDKISYTSGTAEDVSASNYKYFKVTATSKYCVLTSIVVTYTTDASCDNKVTLSKGTENNGTFELDKTGEQNACDALSVTITPPPAEHYHVASVSATDPATTGTAGTAVNNGDGTWTITYSANAKGASTINVTFEEDTKHTLTFYNNGAQVEQIQVYDGEKIGASLPSLTSNEACHATSQTFAGWTTENIGSTPVHTVDVDKIVDYWTKPTGDMTIYAIWATIPASATTTFAAADYSAETAPITKEKDNITLYFDAGSIYKSNTPYTFTITSGNHYFSITASNKVLAKLETTCNDGTYCLYSVSDGTLSPNSSTASQTVTGINTNNVECYPKSTKQIRMQTCAVYCYDNYITACAACDKSLTVKQGTETNGTITLSNSGELESCSALNITVTPSPVAGYQVGEVTATTPSAGGAPTITDNGNGTWTVTYAANSTGSSTINVRFEPLVINILLTSYNDGHIQSCVQEGSATVNYDGTALNDFEPPVRSGFGATPGYWTAPSGGVKVLNADGSFAATDVTGVIVNNHWENIDNPFTLYARFTCNDTVFVTAASSGNGTTTLNSSYVATCDCEELAQDSIDVEFQRLIS